jgi:hypothetical protein
MGNKDQKRAKEENHTQSQLSFEKKNTFYIFCELFRHFGAFRGLTNFAPSSSSFFLSPSLDLVLDSLRSSSSSSFAFAFSFFPFSSFAFAIAFSSVDSPCLLLSAKSLRTHLAFPPSPSPFFRGEISKSLRAAISDEGEASRDFFLLPLLLHIISFPSIFDVFFTFEKGPKKGEGGGAS